LRLIVYNSTKRVIFYDLLGSRREATGLVYETHNHTFVFLENLNYYKIDNDRVINII